MNDNKAIKKTLVREAAQLIAKRLSDFKLAGKVVVKIDSQVASKNVKQSSK